MAKHSKTTPSAKKSVESNFLNLIDRRGRDMLSVAYHFSLHGREEGGLTRLCLGRLLSESTQLEELLDACGALNNRTWRPFRVLMATVKRFADAGYEMLHMRYSCSSYKLLPIEQDFIRATDEAIAFVAGVLERSCKQVLAQAASLGLEIPQQECQQNVYAEELFCEQLPHDLEVRQIENVRETVTSLATAFLNVAAECELIHAAGRAKPREYASYIPDPVSEERLRYLGHRVHNLQSLYDTHVSETETEELDQDLPVLRGHISVVMHLLNTATDLVHYYERHGDSAVSDASGLQEVLVDRQELLATLMNYSITFGSSYLSCAKHICHELLKRYAEVGQIEVPAPRYRGFHVRPSTLVARIVLHYGSEVKMEVGGQSYDASTPFEIFRANEKISAYKRRKLASAIASLGFIQEDADGSDVQAVARRVVLAMAERGKVVIYEQPLKLQDGPVPTEGTLFERVIDEVCWLQATGKIDIEAELSIGFVGDKRVLADIKLLAESGYGEDNMGNNIVLPTELAYLRR